MNNTERSLYDVLEESAEIALDEQRDDGSMPPGQNGPWNDKETPVRNTGHWTVTFLKCYQWTEREEFRDAAEAAVSYLKSNESRPYGETFHHRKSDDRDGCNGLIGQAWTIEALVTASEVLGRPELVDLASRVFLKHPFDRDLAAWHPVEIDGAVLPIDMTFNHQLWFAAAGGLLANHSSSNPAVNEQVQHYLDELDENLNLMENGLVYHPFKPNFDVVKYGKIFLQGLKAGTAHTMVLGVLQGIIGGDGEDNEGGWTEESAGYHSFNLYGFALLQEAYPNHSIWKHEKIERAVAYARSEDFVEALDENPYGYPYNCSGIEMAYALDVLTDAGENARRRWLERQFDRTYEPNSRSMSRNNPDPTTLTARLYEATRISETTFGVPESGDD